MQRRRGASKLGAGQVTYESVIRACGNVEDTQLPCTEHVLSGVRQLEGYEPFPVNPAVQGGELTSRLCLFPKGARPVQVA